MRDSWQPQAINRRFQEAIARRLRVEMRQKGLVEREFDNGLIQRSGSFLSLFKPSQVHLDSDWMFHFHRVEFVQTSNFCERPASLERAKVSISAFRVSWQRRMRFCNLLGLLPIVCDSGVDMIATHQDNDDDDGWQCIRRTR